MRAGATSKFDSSKKFDSKSSFNNKGKHNNIILSAIIINYFY
jgi:hypothetical protein